MPTLPLLSEHDAVTWVNETHPRAAELAAAIAAGDAAAEDRLTYAEHLGRAAAVGMLRRLYFKTTGRVFLGDAS